MAESEASKFMGKVGRGGPLSMSQVEESQAAARVEMRADEGPFDAFSLSQGDKKRYGLRDEEVHGYIRDPNHPVWKRTEGDSRLRQVSREYGAARVLTDENGECLHVGEDLIAVGVPRSVREQKQAVVEEEKDAYIARNPILALEAGMAPPEIEALIAKYRSEEYLEARDAEFNMEDRARMRMRVEMQRAQSELARRQRLSPTFGLTYYEAVDQYERQIRRDIEAVTGRRPSEQQVTKAYTKFRLDMESKARQGAMDNRERDWAAVVDRARARSQGQQFAIGPTGLGETTQEKVRRRTKGD
jgi:hypothetical protein